MAERRFVRLVGEIQRTYAKRLIDQSAANDVMQIGKATRSLEQNAKMHPMLDDILRQVPAKKMLSRDDLKLQFLNALGQEMRFLPELEGEGLFPVGLRSSTLTKEQFSGLIELIYKFGAEHDVKWSEPDKPQSAAA